MCVCVLVVKKAILTELFLDKLLYTFNAVEMIRNLRNY